MLFLLLQSERSALQSASTGGWPKKSVALSGSLPQNKALSTATRLSSKATPENPNWSSLMLRSHSDNFACARPLLQSVVVGAPSLVYASYCHHAQHACHCFFFASRWCRSLIRKSHVPNSALHRVVRAADTRWWQRVALLLSVRAVCCSKEPYWTIIELLPGSWVKLSIASREIAARTSDRIHALLRCVTSHRLNLTCAVIARGGSAKSPTQRHLVISESSVGLKKTCRKVC